MSAIAAIAQGPLQELRAQALQTLFAAIDMVEAVKPINPRGGLPQQVQQPMPAVVIAPPQNGRIMIAMAGQVVELPLSPELQAAANRDSSLLREGARLAILPDVGARTLRLLPPADAAPRVPAATLNAIRAFAPGPSVEPAPPLPQVFVQGSPGAAIQRLTGLSFPLAETPTTATVPQGTNLLLPAQRQTSAALSTLPAPVAQAALFAAARQGPIAPAISSLIASAPDMPEAMRLAAARLDAGAVPDGGSIEHALRQSGVFLEAGLARGQVPHGDLKSLLLMLRGAFVTPGENASTPRAETAAQNREALLPRAAQAQSSGDLMRLVEGAVERIKLNQLASLPELPGMRVTDERPQGFQLTTTIPLATQGLDRPQTAAIGMMIEHHPVENHDAEIESDEEPADEVEGFPWKVRIALDLEETGPVQAEIALRGQTVAITLWAERRTIADLARREIGALHDKLTEAAFDVSRLEVRDGRPIGAAPRATRVLDQRT